MVDTISLAARFNRYSILDNHHMALSTLIVTLILYIYNRKVYELL